MIKIGILGSDNSHALAFAKLCNIPDENGNYIYDDIRITAIYGKDDDPEHTRQVAEEGKIEYIAKSPDEFFGRVDAVMVVYRRGSYHVPGIIPFVEKGIPCWIDKPVCKDISDAKMLKEAWEKGKGLVTGGSTVKYNYDLITAKNMLESGTYGKLAGGFMNFPGDMASEYEGLYFYGSHLVEITLTLFGYDVKSVTANAADHDKIAVIAEYEGYNVCLNYNPVITDYFITVIGDKGGFTKKMDLSIVYKLGFEKFVWMLHKNRMPLEFDKLVKPVYVLNAIDKSIKEGRKIYIEELNK